MILYFENSRRKKSVVGYPQDKSQALHMIEKFCDERNYKIHYTRMWDEPDGTHFDVGSHSEFFILEEGHDIGCPDDYGYYCMAYCDDVSDFALDLCKACWEESVKCGKKSISNDSSI